jgi:hypothetical protein
MRRCFWYSLVLALAAAPLAAQGDPQCNSATTTPAQNACNTAVDAMKAFSPLAGMLISGGNPVLGTAGTLGGFGHIAFSARVNATKVALPNPDSAFTSGSSVAAGFTGTVPAPVVEASLGVLRGMGGGLLSVDALGSAVLLPTNQVNNLSVDPNATKIGSVALGTGYGARVGLIKGGLLVPAVSVSWMHRHLPRVQYGDVNAGDPMDFAMELDATNLRAVAGMRFLLFDVAAGLGVDHYVTSGRIRYQDITVQTVTVNPKNTRQVLFADAGMNFLVTKLVGEIGWQSGKDQGFTRDSFGSFDPKAGHVFGSIGARFSF